MPHEKTKPAVLIGGILLTLVTLVAVEWLPPRTLVLTTPGAVTNLYLAAPAATASGPGPVQWVDATRLHLRCAYQEAMHYQPCGLTIVLGADTTHGRDLSGFDSLEMDLKYEGTSPFVRVGIRNFDPRFSTPEDGNSSRMHSVNLRPRDVAGTVHVDLSELTVPEWWIQQFNLAREYNRPSLDNATTLTIDLPADVTGKVQELELRHLALQGEWISRDRIYLGIVCTWLLAASSVLLRNWQRMRQQHSLQQREIDALTARTRQLRLEQDKLRRLATIDELTGVLNRRGLEQALGDLEEASAGMTILMVDIDHFKRINDRHGHDVGDAMLCRVAAVIAANLRATDVVGRWGGEEFLVACRGTRTRDAMRLAEKLRERIEACHVAAPLGRITATASFGVAMAPPGMPAAGAVKRADEALYRAKGAGRNRVEGDTSLAGDAPTTV